jgi:pimeloyl-ACP methyl ester carboxylesterase
LPPDWEALQPPPGVDSGGSLDNLRGWLVGELERRPGRVLLAGHSMGAALAMLAAASTPERVSALVLIAPAGLPLAKPIRESVSDFVRQLGAGTHRLRDVVESATELAHAPRAGIRLARALRRLDLSPEMDTIRAAGVPTTVIGCTTDTLVTPEQCRRVARRLSGRYRELALGGGHVWMFGRWPLLARELAGSATPLR